MSFELQPDEVFDHADQHREKANQLMNKRGILRAELQQLRNEGASNADINEKIQEIQDTNTRITKEITIAGDLDAKAILNILVATDVTNAVNEIKKASDQVQQAVDNINNVRRALQYVDLFIRLGGAIASAAITGSPAAQIAAIIGAIDTLYQTDF